MPDLSFQVYEAEAVAYAASPLLNFQLGVANANVEEPIHNVALRCQIQRRVAPAAPRRVRPVVSIQDAARHSDVGTGD